MQKKILIGLIGLALLIPSPVYAKKDESFKNLSLPAGQVDLNSLPPEFKKTLEKRTIEINNYLENLEELRIKASQIQIEAQKQSDSGQVTINTASKLKQANKKLTYYENNSLEIVGLVKMENDVQGPIIQPLSTASQATVKSPTIFYDNDTSSYVLSSGWNWNTINPDNNNGSNDGFGLRVNQEKVSILSDHITTFNYYGEKYWPDYSTVPSAYGYYQKFEDIDVYRNYTAHSGTSWMFFRFFNGTPLGKTVNFNGQYSHTWEGASLTGIGIGANTFLGTFSISNKGWKTDEYSWKTF